MQITLYGIKNCSSVQKARAWLAEQQISYVFHDYKSAGIDAPRLTLWCQQHGWERVLNRAGTTFRKLSEADKQNLDQSKAIALMCAQPSLIKRPILAWDTQSLLGFQADQYAHALHNPTQQS